MNLNGREWDETIQKLAATFGVRSRQREVDAFKSTDMPVQSRSAAYESIPVGKLSSLQEDDSHYYATAVIEKTDERLKLAAVAWPKESLESWVARTEKQAPAATEMPTGIYTILGTSEGAGCIDDTWTGMSGPPDVRGGPTAVWTGSEMIVWGGATATFTYFQTGGRYNPATDNWTGTSNINAPSARASQTAVWSGSEMIVWGGNNGSDLNTGGRYDPNHR